MRRSGPTQQFVKVLVSLKIFLIFSKLILNYNSITGINHLTFDEWAYIVDNEIPFITVERKGGAKRVTTEDDDKVLASVTLENNWLSLDEIK